MFIVFQRFRYFFNLAINFQTFVTRNDEKSIYCMKKKLSISKVLLKDRVWYFHLNIDLPCPTKDRFFIFLIKIDGYKFDHFWQLPMLRQMLHRPVHGRGLPVLGLLVNFVIHHVNHASSSNRGKNRNRVWKKSRQPIKHCDIYYRCMFVDRRPLRCTRNSTDTSCSGPIRYRQLFAVVIIIIMSQT